MVRGMGSAMRAQPYEIRFYRNTGKLSLLWMINFASDRHAMSSARLLLDDTLPTATVWQDGRAVGELAWIPAQIAA